MNEPQETALRNRAEALLATTNEKIGRMPPAKIRALVHELQVHKIELEIQNEELRQAQLELADARDRYADLFDFAPVGYVAINAEGAVRNANLTAAAMLGRERGRLVGARLSGFVRAEDRGTLARLLADNFGGGGKQVCELEFRRGAKDKAGPIFRLECILPDQQLLGEPVCFAALIDVTAQRESEEFRLEQQCFHASEAEKSRIACELHDDLGSLLKGIELHAATLVKQLNADGSERRDAARTIVERLGEAIRQTRDLALGLHPLGDPAALLPALERLAEFARAAGFDCRLNLSDKLVEPSDPQVANHLYRIAREAVQNAIHHSGAGELRLGLKVDRGFLVLSIRDNGRGCDPDAAGQGLGIQIMRYRTRAIGGALTIQAGKPRGTEVVCRVLATLAPPD